MNALDELKIQLNLQKDPEMKKANLKVPDTLFKKTKSIQSQTYNISYSNLYDNFKHLYIQQNNLLYSKYT